MLRGSVASIAFGCLCTFAASVAFGASSARACSGPSCGMTAVLPPAGGSVPANAVQLIWRKSRIFAGEISSELHLYAVDGGRRRELDFSLTSVPGDASGSLLKVVPRAPVAPGTELAVEAEELCLSEGAPFTSSLRVGPAAPAPVSLGKLEIESQGEELVELWVTSGECYRNSRVASARLRVVLSEAARPYADLLRYELQVDGRPYTTQEALPDWRQRQSSWPIGASVLGRGADRVYRVCDGGDRASTSGVSEGTHRAQMFALLPDGTRIASDEIALELRCGLPAASDAGSIAGDDAGADPSADAGATLADASRLGASAEDAGGAFDAGGAGEAASNSSAAVYDAGALGEGTDEPRGERRARGESGHCSPLIGARAGRPLLWVLFVLVLSIVASRTKRRRDVPGSARQSRPDSAPRSSPRL